MFDMFRRKSGASGVEVERLIQSYVDAGATAKVAQHLDACRRCGLSADDHRRLKSALNEAATHCRLNRCGCKTPEHGTAMTISSG